jgi:hypothetical protein
LSQTALLSGWTCSTLTCGHIQDKTDQIHWDSSFIKTPSGVFLVTGTTRPVQYLRLLTFHSTSGLFLLRERTVFNHIRTSVRHARGPYSFERTKMVQGSSRTQTICILEDTRGQYRVTFASYVDLSIQKQTFCSSGPLNTILPCHAHIYLIQ